MASRPDAQNARTQSHPRDREPVPDTALDHLTAELSRLNFGSVQVTVHDGRIVQIDVTERRRFGA